MSSNGGNRMDMGGEERVGVGCISLPGHPGGSRSKHSGSLSHSGNLQGKGYHFCPFSISSTEDFAVLNFSSGSVSAVITAPLSLLDDACLGTICLLSALTCAITTGTSSAIVIHSRVGVCVSVTRTQIGPTQLHLNCFQQDVERAMCSQPR